MDDHKLSAHRLQKFHHIQIQAINTAVAMAEELVSNHYKMSASQWLRRKYDIKTQADLAPNEIVEGPFAQVIRYEGQRRDSSLGSGAYDFYVICLQDHAILAALRQSADLVLMPFIVYIVVHELIHIVRFSQFLQNFDASPDEIAAEETRVHDLTRKIISPLNLAGVEAVLRFYRHWCQPVDSRRSP